MNFHKFYVHKKNIRGKKIVTNTKNSKYLTKSILFSWQTVGGWKKEKRTFTCQRLQYNSFLQCEVLIFQGINFAVFYFDTYNNDAFCQNNTINRILLKLPNFPPRKNTKEWSILLWAVIVVWQELGMGKSYCIWSLLF